MPFEIKSIYGLDHDHENSTQEGKAIGAGEDD